MTAYLIVAVTYLDKKWTEAYRRDVAALVAAHGGRYLAKSLNPEQLEGDGPAPDTLAVLEFPRVEDARSLLASPTYAPFAEARRNGAKTSILLI